jgi:cyclohexanone monooxygenase
MQYGPNTNYYAIVFNLERQADFIVRVLKRMSAGGARRAEVDRGWFDRYNAWLTRRLERSSFATTDSYFRSASGKVVTQWPDGALLYWALTRLTASSAMRLQ